MLACVLILNAPLRGLSSRPPYCGPQLTSILVPKFEKHPRKNIPFSSKSVVLWSNNTPPTHHPPFSAKRVFIRCTVWCPNSVRCPNSVTHKNSCLTISYSKQTTQETSAIILENIYFIMITNVSYKGDHYIMKNAVKSSVCEIEPFRWLIHQWLT